MPIEFKEVQVRIYEEQTSRVTVESSIEIKWNIETTN